MAGAVPTIGCHFFEKELIGEKVGILYLGACEVAWSLFSDKAYFYSAKTSPPPFRRKMVKNLPAFYKIKNIFWQLIQKKSDKTLLDWVRPPPLVQKNLSIF